MTTDIIAAALREYGDAFRGSWGDVDGRAVKLVMDSFSDAIEGIGSSAGYTLEEWRNYLDLCPYGLGHWTEFCDENCATVVIVDLLQDSWYD